MKQALLIAGLAFCCGANAQTATLMRPESMRAEPFTDARQIASVPQGAKVTILERKGTWARVSRESSVGWLRGLNLKADDAVGLKAEGLLAMSTGREGRGGIAVPLGIRSPGPGPGLLVLEQVFQSRDRSRKVTLSARQGDYQVGRGAIELTLSADRSGFAYVFMVDQRDGAIHFVYPNADAPDNEFSAGGNLRIPGAAAPYAPAVPKGELIFLALVTDAPLDLVLPDKQLAGPYFSVPASAENQDLLAAALAGRLTSCSGAACPGYGAAARVIDARH